MAESAAPPPADLARLASLDDPVRRRLYDHVCARGEPVAREEAAAATGVGRSLAAYHLDKLVEAGLLVTTYRRPAGRGGPGAGRPAKLYSRARREVVASVPPRRYDLVARVLAEAVEREATGAAQAALREVAHELGRELGATAARSGKDARPAFVAVLQEHGYVPVTDGDGVMTLRNCPFDAVARAHAEVVCAMNLALVEGILTGLGVGRWRAALNPRADRCCVVIQPVGS